MNTHPLLLRITLSWPGRLLLGALLALLLQAVAARAERYRRPDATLDLRTSEGVRRAGGAWRYRDTVLRPIDHRAPGPDLKASGPPNRSFDFVPDARAADFDDGGWDEIAAESLESRRGSGRLSFGWYRIAVTLPERVGGLDTRGSTVVFEIVVDDYAEVWVNGQASWVLGQSGGPVAAGWNAPNRVALTRDARPGDRFQIAVLGINGRKMFETWYQMESLLLSGRLELDEIITHEIPMADFAKGFRLMQSGEGIKIVLNVA